MGIRCSSKAIIINDGKVLLNQCTRANGQVYYDLPGGGQDDYETMENAIIREVMEETGYHIRVLSFAAMAEEIYTDEELRRQYPNYTHRILHIFKAELKGDQQETVTGKDYCMNGSVWMPIGELELLPEICPRGLQERFMEIIESEKPVYMGTVFVDWEKA